MALLSVLLSPAAGQTQAALAEPEAGMPAPVALTIRRVVPEVQMVFAAKDHHGRPALGLGAGEIKVLDNGVAASLTSFQAAASLPLRIGLLLDGSESMRRSFAAERRAALAFLRGGQRSASDQIFVMTFAARERSGEGAVSVPAMGGQTALYDSLIGASKMLASVEPACRVLLLFSDGEDNYSRATLAEAIAALQQWNIVVYSITVHSSRLEYPGDRVLRQIAAATGGRAFLLSSYARASRVFAGVERELNGQYVVGFRPVGALARGEFHAVKIVARGAVIRARSGYYVGSDN
ncbi:MAG: VWA domain-containing protein [Chlamydiota bacterium]